MNRNYIFKKDYDIIRKVLKNDREADLLNNLLSKFINLGGKRVHEGFEYHFFYNQSGEKSILTEISGYERKTLGRILKRLKEKGYINYRKSYSPNCAKRQTTLWYINVENIYKDFGINLNAIKAKAQKTSENGTQNVTDSLPPEVPEKDIQQDGESTPDQKHGINISIPPEHDTRVFDIDTLPESEKDLFNYFKSIKNATKRQKEMKKHKYTIINADIKFNAFNVAYPINK